MLLLFYCVRSAPTGYCRVARLLIVFALFALPLGGRAQEYEVDGTIDMRIFKPDRITSRDYPGSFRVYVKDSGWLIQVTETNMWGILQRREVGTTDGKEVFEMEVPLEAGKVKPNATITSNAIPVGTLDTSLIAHLWLMFASGSYFRSAAAGNLAPVYDWRATPAMNHHFTLKATWELLNGPGLPPSRVTYFNPDGSASGVYRATGSTNVGAFILPSGFHFNQPDTGHKEIDAVVTAVRNTCSLSDLRPEIKQRMVMTDLRWHPADIGGGFTAYKADYWPTVKQAQGIYYSTRGGPGAPLNPRSKLLLAILMALVIAPPVVIVLRNRWLRGSPKPSRSLKSK